MFTALSKQQATIQDTLSQYAQKANSLWANKTHTLDFASKYLSEVSQRQAEKYYQSASVYYFWSLQNASFKNDKDAIENEVNQLLPLVPDSTQKQWKEYLDQENPQLLNEIIGFWKVHDPYSSTTINERLIEHRQRVRYAQSAFNKNHSSPYGTDDRGTIYIRLGAPDQIIKKNIHLSSVFDPVSFKRLYFELGNIVQTRLEIWEYNIGEDDNMLFLFGPRNGYGEYGLRRSPMELIDSKGVLIEVNKGNFIPLTRMRKFSERVIKVGLYRELAPLHPFYDQMYQMMETSLYNSDLHSSLIQRYLQSAFIAETLINMKFYRQRKQTPPERSTLVLSDEHLDLRTQTFHFLNTKNESEYLFSVQAYSDEDKTIRDDQSFFLSNKLNVYDKDWNLVDTIDDLKHVNNHSVTNPSTYQISESVLENNDVYFSSELIDTSRNNILLPGKINSAMSGIVSASGKRKVTFSKPTGQKDEFQISDIVISNQQDIDSEARIPIQPKLDYKFKENSDVMIYFEAYNVPEEGYTFTYYFKKDRFLLPHKKVNRSQITVLSENNPKVNNELFTINLKDLKPDSYQLVFEFEPKSGPQLGETIQKIIDITIEE